MPHLTAPVREVLLRMVPKLTASQAAHCLWVLNQPVDRPLSRPAGFTTLAMLAQHPETGSRALTEFGSYEAVIGPPTSARGPRLATLSQIVADYFLTAATKIGGFQTLDVIAQCTP